MINRVRIEDIAFDAETQIRAAISEAVVAHYADCMSEGAVFPPVVLFHDGNRYYLADGFHRGLASKRIGFADITADVRPGTKTDALWFALGANRTNGHQMTAADKKHAIELAIRTWPDRSGREIADQIGCNQNYFSEVRRQVSATTQLPERVTGKDGKSYPAVRPTAVSAAPHPKRYEVMAMVAEGKASAEIRKELGVRPELIADVRREVGVASADKSRDAVQSRWDRMQAMSAEGYTTRQIASAVGVAEETCRATFKKHGVDVSADRVVGSTKRHDSTRIVEHMVMDAENLTADIGLIDFAELEPEQLGLWIQSLHGSRKALGSFIRRLEQEQKKHVEAA